MSRSVAVGSASDFAASSARSGIGGAEVTEDCGCTYDECEPPCAGESDYERDHEQENEENKPMSEDPLQPRRFVRVR